MNNYANNEFIHDNNDTHDLIYGKIQSGKSRKLSYVFFMIVIKVKQLIRKLFFK